MDRRTFGRLIGTGVAACAVMGHSPYRQWHVYRKSRLIIVTSAADRDAYPLGEAVAAVLAEHLPESRAMAARTANSVEVVKLLSSDQLEVALLAADEAAEAYAGRDRFAAVGPLSLRALAVLGRFVLVSRESFPTVKAEAIARTLAQHWRRDATPTTISASIPLHSGVVGAAR